MAKKKGKQKLRFIKFDIHRQNIQAKALTVRVDGKFEGTAVRLKAKGGGRSQAIFPRLNLACAQ